MPRYTRPWLAGEIEDFEKKGRANQSSLNLSITGRNLLSFSSWRAEKAFSLFPPTTGQDHSRRKSMITD